MICKIYFNAVVYLKRKKYNLRIERNFLNMINSTYFSKKKRNPTITVNDKILTVGIATLMLHNTS